jgi:large subunit ribosomal protein L24
MLTKIKKGDTVKIRVGKDRSKTGKVIRVLPNEEKIVVEGINTFKKHSRPRRTGEKGGIVSKPMPFPAARAMVVCSKCGKSTRVGFQIKGDNKFRICKKCGQEL